MKPASFIGRAVAAKREEQVVDAYQQLLRIDDLPRPFGSDGLADDTLFEAKLDLNLAENYARCLAQATYYIYRVVNIGVDKGVAYSVPTRIVVCDRNEALVVPTAQVEPFVRNATFDWDRPPSAPDPMLVAAIKQSLAPKVFDTSSEVGVESFLAAYAAGGQAILQEITAQNFVKIYEIWKSKFGVGLGHQEAAMAYLLDLQKLGVFRNGKLRLSGDPDQSGRSVTMDVAADEDAYLEFWRIYRRPPTSEEFSKIVAGKDRLVATTQRRMTGEFFTPADVALRAHEYLCRAAVNCGLVSAPEELYAKAYWWDCCAGSGNLVVDCPAMPNRLFVSTLEKEDIEHMRLVGLHPEAEIFQLDFLNAEVFPEHVERALNDVGHPWVVLINPPFAAGTDLHASRGKVGQIKTDVNATAVRSLMLRDKMGVACENLFSQFMWRLTKILPTGALLGLFSPIFVGGVKYSKFFEWWLVSWESLGGFGVQSQVFTETADQWPVGFSIWRRR